MSAGKGWQEASGEKTLDEVARDFMEGQRSRLEEEEGEKAWHSSQLKDLLERMVPVITRRSEDEGISAQALDERLSFLASTIFHLSFGLNFYADKHPGGLIWSNPKSRLMSSRPESWSDDSPVLLENVDGALAIYSSHPWMQHNLFESYMLRGYLFDTAARIAHEALSGRSLGTINWAYTWAIGRQEKAIWLRLLFDTLKPLARWALPPAVVVGFYYYGFRDWALWLAWPVGIWLVISLLTLPRRFLWYRRARRDTAACVERVAYLEQAYMAACGRVLSPRHLAGLLKKVEGKGGSLPSGLHALLGLMMRRDAEIFVPYPGDDRY